MSANEINMDIIKKSMQIDLIKKERKIQQIIDEEIPYFPNKEKIKDENNLHKRYEKEATRAQSRLIKEVHYKYYDIVTQKRADLVLSGEYKGQPIVLTEEDYDKFLKEKQR